LTHEDEVALKDEIEILQELQHPNIIRLYDVFEEKDFYYLVTEKMAGGELFDRIVQKSYYNEKEARDTCVILFKAIQYCHDKQVAHRDLKVCLQTSNVYERVQPACCRTFNTLHFHDSSQKISCYWYVYSL
jgi:serine/threonine protein kinase